MESVLIYEGEKKFCTLYKLDNLEGYMSRLKSLEYERLIVFDEKYLDVFRKNLESKINKINEGKENLSGLNSKTLLGRKS